MGIIDTLQRIIRPQAPDAAKAAFAPLSYGQSWLRGMDFYNRYSFKFPDEPQGWTRAVRSNVWAFNCVNARANAFSAVPLKLYKRSGKPEVEDECIEEHPILELLETVNSVYLDRASFRHAAQWQRVEQGGAIIRKIRDGSGKPVELYVLPAHLVTPEPDPRLLVSHYTYAGQFIPREDVIRWYYIDSSNPLAAMSPTSVAVRAINRYNVADIAAQAIDERGGRGGGIISSEVNILDPDMRRYMDEWNDRWANPENAGMDGFMPPGMEYATGTLTAQQMQREERAMRLAKEIMAAYGVPPSLAGDYSDASVLANAAQQSTNFWQSVMLYELQSFADTLTYYMLWQDWPESKDEGLYLKHDTDEIAALQDDELKEAEVERAEADRATVLMAGGVISLNEAREIVDMEPIKDERADEVLPPEMDDMEDPEAVDDPAMQDGEDMPDEDVTDPEDDALDAEVADILGEDPAVKSDVPGQMGPRGGAASGGKFDEGKVKRDGGKFAAKEGSGGDKPKKTRKKDPKKEAERKAKQAAKRVEKAQERIAKLDADEAKLKDALAKMQGKDDPSNLRKRIGKALERVAKRREKMQAIIDRKGEKDNTPAASEADKLASEVAGKASVTLMPVVDFVGMTATDTSGTVLGVVDSIKRQGQYDGITATPSQPVVVVAGKAYRGDAVRVVVSDTLTA